ncbi:minor capsid protein [bacterium]|nr:minor capsid protein [bacterium]
MIAELDNLIQILEAQIPANPNSAKNVRLRRKLEKELVKYFKSLENAFPFGKLDRIYNRYVKESLGSDTGNIVDPILSTLRTTLFEKLNNQLLAVWVSGTAEMVSWGQTKAGIPIAYEGPPIQGAIDWAKKHTATLVKGIDEETKKRLAYTIKQGIETKRGIPGLARDIRSTFTDMSKHRSELIARTETANALSQASLETMEDMGIDGKEWVTAGDDKVSDECLGNEAEGVIPVGQAFSGGVMAPPQHPDCRCTLSPARLRR